MAESDSTHRDVTRRRFITASGALGFGAAVAGAVGWPAAGDPAGNPPNCGNDKDGGVLYEAVKEAQPGDKGLALVDFPTPNKDRAYGYAIKTGGKGSWDWLCIPLTRVSGIECEKCWKGEVLNLWPYALAWVNNPKSQLANTDWALAINSGDPQARRENQLHIHVTKLKQSVRDQITAAEKNKTPVAGSFADWPNKTITLTLTPNNDQRLFRWVHQPSLDHHIFVDAFNTVAKKQPAEMAHQCLAVVKAGPGGYYILDSQGQLNTQGHHPFGIKTIDGLLDRG